MSRSLILRLSLRLPCGSGFSRDLCLIIATKIAPAGAVTLKLSFATLSSAAIVQNLGIAAEAAPTDDLTLNPALDRAQVIVHIDIGPALPISSPPRRRGGLRL